LLQILDFFLNFIIRINVPKLFFKSVLRSRIHKPEQYFDLAPAPIVLALKMIDRLDIIQNETKCIFPFVIYNNLSSKESDFKKLTFVCYTNF
jgi:hypothetical protein